MNFLVRNTKNAKFIVISNKIDDLEDQGYKFSLEIKELSKDDAVNLLLFAAGDCKNLRHFNSNSQLSKHKIFDYFTYKPTGIL